MLQRVWQGIWRRAAASGGAEWKKAAVAGRKHVAAAFSTSVSVRGDGDADCWRDPRLFELQDTEEYNVPEDVRAKVGRNLHKQAQHPLHLIAATVKSFFDATGGITEGSPSGAKAVDWRLFDSMNPVVTTQANFDELLIPKDHVSRSPSDTFYLNRDLLLRCHTSAHQTELMRAGERAFLCAGDVYRRDAVDSSHYPVFHQMEGVRIYSHDELPPDTPREAAVEFVSQDLKAALDGMVKTVFGEVDVRWIDEYFPFTDPSFEMEIFFQDEWMEVLGCGMIHQGVMDKVGLGDHYGYAFGLGLERLAMVLFGIPDIRLFWSTDTRFSDQFADGGWQADGRPVQFKPYSKYPPVFKDLSVWLPDASLPGVASSTARELTEEDKKEGITEFWHPHDLYELVRSVAGDVVERVDLQETFVHPVSGRTSHLYRMTYRSMDRSLTNAEIDELQWEVRRLVEEKLGGELR